MEPYEIIANPLTLWLAPSGEAFPAIDAAPAGNWAKIGTSGTRNYSEEGLVVSASVSFQKARPAGASGPVKAFIDEEDLMFRLTMWDMTLEQFAKALNDNTVTTTAAGSGTAGFKKIGLSRGLNVTEFALLARGPSPYDETMNMQFEVPRCFNSASPEMTFRKGVPAGVLLQYEALEDLNASSEDERFGRLIGQHQVALP
jgi:hypothetical protein